MQNTHLPPDLSLKKLRKLTEKRKNSKPCPITRKIATSAVISGASMEGVARAAGVLLPTIKRWLRSSNESSKEQSKVQTLLVQDNPPSNTSDVPLLPYSGSKIELIIGQLTIRITSEGSC